MIIQGLKHTLLCHSAVYNSHMDQLSIILILFYYNIVSYHTRSVLQNISRVSLAPVPLVWTLDIFARYTDTQCTLQKLPSALPKKTVLNHTFFFETWRSGDICKSVVFSSLRIIRLVSIRTRSLRVLRRLERQAKA